ncbi:HAMP domain-containing sensor histidine kinase [Colwellia sp. 4_MG-2023]|uniref:sensor histidine kinase n=1 Tax=unclassified Colwellia TaxID=196834 RepID=UPI001C0A4CDD|nr:MULTISPECIES: HAMP domain-containing sensor histidine kinase [unclassified Colwellia]MBU2923290.1 HAMP domain-containing histidine kinase [Colwellia sp. C2M11]MDO6489414.1 HAMP domain-containing sensor histidine kinase [Colwellia sp. 6_MG-2023]MDO6507001.1 HAMP domain-containing sensor histidine kinase [Colwellia sp. 5_MG-2023]MDO6557197.1 HAMP domain-containing sensor histidine kinase [Colwellia sp. 4_MG-2023]MDO6653989.1 HAMP domain-containing sensor histidine kinase [Colwellia sp. 3_MG-2
MDKVTPVDIDSLNIPKNRLIKLFWAVQSALAIIAIQYLFTDNQQIIYAIIFTIIIIMPVYFLAQRNKLELGTNILLLLLTVILLAFVWIYNGLRDEILFAFPALIMISLLKGSHRLAFFLYILVAINLLSIGYLNEMGYIHNETKESDIHSAILLIIILSFISYIAWLIAVEIKQTNQALIDNKNELENRVKQRTIELEQSINNLKNTQEQLIQTEKMASLGRLVAGVAHEINTPIGITITASSHLEDATNDFYKLYQNDNITKKALVNYVETATASSKLLQSNLNRAADLIQGFKEVAIDQSNEEIREFKLKAYINDVLSSLRPKIARSGIQVNLNSPDDLVIKTSPGAIAQIITNLVINAITHAFEQEKGGTITINIEQKDQQINMQFKDSGCGIPTENLGKIFEPFFTTKRGQGGSGLGMHIVYNLVTQSLHGNITCSSNLGKGTCFHINFPRQ